MIDALIERIDAHSALKIDRLETKNDALDEIETLRILGLESPPEELSSFYLQSNGVTLIWSGEVENKIETGHLNILSVLNSCLRAPLVDGDEPNEGMLWTVDTPEPELSQLKKMTIFEAVAGRDDHITYQMDDTPVRPYLVSDWNVSSITGSFGRFLELLLHFGGSDRFRDHLRFPDWENRSCKDRALLELFGDVGQRN